MKHSTTVMLIAFIEDPNGYRLSSSKRARAPRPRQTWAAPTYGPALRALSLRRVRAACLRLRFPFSSRRRSREARVGRSRAAWRGTHKSDQDPLSQLGAHLQGCSSDRGLAD